MFSDGGGGGGSGSGSGSGGSMEFRFYGKISSAPTRTSPLTVTQPSNGSSGVVTYIRAANRSTTVDCLVGADASVLLG